MNKRVRYLFGILIIIVGLAGFLFVNTLKGNGQYDKTKTYLVQGQNNLFAVYKDKLSVQIPYDINLDKDQTVGDLVSSASHERILSTMNKILPEPVENYRVIKYGKTNIDVQNEKTIPETVIDNKRYILTSSLYNLFDSYYNEKNLANELNENIIVDVLNANGRQGYARRTGENIAKNLGMKYNAQNYETNKDMSYIYLNNISNDKAEAIVKELNEKYIKIEKKSSLPTLANVVVILGKEENIPFIIEISGSGNNLRTVATQLEKKGYKNISIEKDKIKSDKKIIEYNSEDYYIAYKIAQILDITDMIERNKLKNKIKIIMN